MKRMLILLLIVAAANVAQAHKGGHHKVHDPQNDRTWQVTNPWTTVEGTFLLAKEGKVYLETSNGVVAVEANKLDWKDQAYVTERLSEIKHINLVSENAVFAPKKAANLMTWLLGGIALVLIAGALFMLIKSPRLKASFSAAMAFILLSTVMVACGEDDPEPCTETLWYMDADEDGLGDPDNSQSACDQPANHVSNDDDPDDADAANCTVVTWYADEDNDGLGDPDNTQVACDQPDGFVSNSDDSDDSGTSSLFSFFNDPTYMASVFELFSSSILGTSSDDEYFYVETNSIPDHPMMVGITAWIAQVPLPNYILGDNAWAIPLNPTFSDETITIEDDLRRGPIAVASNGIPIFNPINASGLVSNDIGELDAYGGHSGRGDDYHYHTAPLHLESTTGGLLPIAYGLDGFAVYGSTEPDGTAMQDLDEYHGHIYNDDYHYHGTEAYPYLIAKVRGKVTLTGDSPETQIEPQPMSTPVRGDPRSASGYNAGDPNFEITALEERASGTGYILSYEYEGLTASVEYYWDESGVYTFEYTDTDGTQETETFNGTVIPLYNPGGTDIIDPDPDPNPTDSFVVTSAGIVDGLLLDEFKCEEKENDIENSLPLAWSGIPDGTGSIAITIHHFPNTENTDEDPNQYLLLWGIDPSVTEIGYGEADDGPWFIGQNKDGTAISYTSPCSPSDATGSKEYTITVYALSETPSTLPNVSSINVDYATLTTAIETVTVLGTTTLTFEDAN